MKSWLAQGSSGRRVTLLPGTTFLHINGALDYSFDKRCALRARQINFNRKKFPQQNKKSKISISILLWTRYRYSYKSKELTITLIMNLNKPLLNKLNTVNGYIFHCRAAKTLIIDQRKSYFKRRPPIGSMAIKLQINVGNYIRRNLKKNASGPCNNVMW